MKKILPLLLLFMVLLSQAHSTIQGFYAAKYKIIRHTNADWQISIATLCVSPDNRNTTVAATNSYQQNDTLFVDAFHLLCDNSVSYGTNLYWHADTVNLTTPFSGINYLKVTSNAIICGPTVNDPFDTVYNAFDSTFDLKATAVNNPAFNSNRFCFPNPAHDEIVIGNSSKQLLSATLNNMQGQLIYHAAISGSKAVIPVKDYPTGLYLLRVQTNDGEVYSEKIVIR